MSSDEWNCSEAALPGWQPICTPPSPACLACYSCSALKHWRLAHTHPLPPALLPLLSFLQLLGGFRVLPTWCRPLLTLLSSLCSASMVSFGWQLNTQPASFCPVLKYPWYICIHVIWLLSSEITESLCSDLTHRSRICDHPTSVFVSSCIIIISSVMHFAGSLHIFKVQNSPPLKDLYLLIRNNPC